jgi:hypothetical protein
VAAALEALGVALAADDEAARAHRAGDDAELAGAGAHRALARDEDVLAEWRSRASSCGGSSTAAASAANGGAARPREPLEDRRHHQRRLAREVLRPADRLDVVVEVLRALAS